MSWQNERRTLVNRPVLKPLERGTRNNRIPWPIPQRPPTSTERRVIKRLRTKKRRQYQEIPGV